jgi:hypothetical protein
MGKHNGFFPRQDVSIFTVITEVIKEYFSDKPFTAPIVATLISEGKASEAYGYYTALAGISLYFKNWKTNNYLPLIRKPFFKINVEHNTFTFVYVLMKNKRMLNHPRGKYMKQLVKPELPKVSVR